MTHSYPIRHPRRSLGVDLITVSTDAQPGGSVMGDPRVVLLLGAALGAGLVTLIFTWKS